MITDQLTARWTTQQAQFIAEFLDELQEALWANYGEELMEFYRWKEHEEEKNNEEPLSMDFDDELPF